MKYKVSQISTTVPANILFGNELKYKVNQQGSAATFLTNAHMLCLLLTKRYRIQHRLVFTLCWKNWEKDTFRVWRRRCQKPCKIKLKPNSIIFSRYNLNNPKFKHSEHISWFQLKSQILFWGLTGPSLDFVTSLLGGGWIWNISTRETISPEPNAKSGMWCNLYKAVKMLLPQIEIQISKA